MPSSTSSSSARPGGGRAWPFAIVLLVLAEIVLRLWQPDGTIPYEIGEREYYALGPELQAFGAREVSIVGDSRSREGILSPALSTVRKRTVSVGNYSLSAARPEEVSSVVARLLGASPRPRLVVYGVTPRQLTPRNEGPVPHVQYFWLLRDWWQMRKMRGGTVDRYLPQVVRNELSEHLRLFRLRPEVFAALHAPVGRHDVPYMLRLTSQRHASYPATPMRGDLPPWKVTQPHDYSTRVTRDAVRKYLGTEFDDPEWPHTYQEAFLAMIAGACKDASVPLVFAEVPASPALLAELPQGTYPGFYEVLEHLSTHYDVPFIRVRDLGLEFAQRDFIEVSHLNYQGAQKYSLALAERLERFLPAD